MRKILYQSGFIMFLILFLTINGFAINMKTILIINDDYNSYTKNLIKSSQKANLNIVSSFINELDTHKDLNIDTQLYNGKDLTLEKLEKGLEDMDLSQSKTVLIYTSGHSINKDGDTLLVLNDGNTISLKKIESLIDRENINLTVTINDTLNSDILNMNPKSIESVPLPLSSILEEENKKALMKLFSGYEGKIRINSSEKDKIGIFTKSGSLLTISTFIFALRNVKNETTWEDVLTNIQERVEKLYKEESLYGYLSDYANELQNIGMETQDIVVDVEGLDEIDMEDNEEEEDEPPMEEEEEEEEDIEVPDVAPYFTLMNQEGQEVSLDDFKGYYIYIMFASDQSSKCHEQSSFLKEVLNILKDEYNIDNFVILILITEDSHGDKPSQELLTEWSDNYGISPILADDEAETASQYGVMDYPFNVVLFPDLTVAGDWIGSVSSAEEFINKLKKIAPKLFE